LKKILKHVYLLKKSHNHFVLLGEISFAYLLEYIILVLRISFLRIFESA
jgi:hypothetical protein